MCLLLDCPTKLSMKVTQRTLTIKKFIDFFTVQNLVLKFASRFSDMQKRTFLAGAN